MWLREKTKELVLCVWLLFWKDFVLYPRNPLSTKLWLRCTLGPEQIDFSTNIWGKTRATVEQVMLIKKKKKNSICECRLRCWEVFGRWANPWDNFLFMRGKNKLSKKLLTVSCYCFDSSWMCKKKESVRIRCVTCWSAAWRFFYLLPLCWVGWHRQVKLLSRIQHILRL